MQAELQYDAGIAAPAIEVCDLVLDRQHRAHRVGRIAERRHHRVADGFDDKAVVALHPLRQEGEMIAHQAVGGGIAEIVVEFCRALQVGEHDRDAADFDVVAGTQQLLRAEPPERRHGDDPLAGQSVLRPVAVLDDEEQRPVGVVAHDKFVRMAVRRQRNIGAARGDLRNDAVGADIGIGFAAGLDGAKAVGAGRQCQRKAFARPRCHFGLQLDVRRGRLPEHAQLAFRQRTKPRLGTEGELDVAGEIALVVDIA